MFSSRPDSNVIFFFLQEEFDEKFGYRPPAQENLLKTFLRRCVLQCCRPLFSFSNFVNTLFAFIPILKWLPNYSVKQNLLPDVIGGITVGIMHVPQGRIWLLPFSEVTSIFFEQKFASIIKIERRNNCKFQYYSKKLWNL